MNANLDTALDYILHDEGGWVLKKNGAAGNFGIGIATLASWRRLNRKLYPTLMDLEALMPAEAKAIYTELYARPIGFDTLPTGVDYAALDAAVNEGPGMGTVEKPGAKRLLMMTEGIADPLERVKAISDIRLERKRRRIDWHDQTINGEFVKGHGEGWTNRIGIWVPQRAAEMIAKEAANASHPA